MNPLKLLSVFSKPEHSLQSVGLRRAIKEVLETSAKEAAKEPLREVLKGHAADAVMAIASEIAGTTALVIAKPLLSSILKVADNNSLLLKRLAGNSFKTGVRVAQEALESPMQERDELWRTRIFEAIRMLDCAYTDATEADRAQIRLIQGLVAVEIGSAGQARRWLEECAAFFERQLASREPKFQKMRKQSSKLRERARIEDERQERALTWSQLPGFERTALMKEGVDQRDYEAYHIERAANFRMTADNLEASVESEIAEVRAFIGALREIKSTMGPARSSIHSAS